MEFSTGKGENSLTLVTRSGSKLTKFHSNYILIAVGREPCIEYLPLYDLKKIEKIPGLFLAGDIKRGDFRQVGIAVGDGLLAAMQAIKYLDEE
jgi:thioredoxin reductase (NADPH)